MPQYRITYLRTQQREAHVDAISESAARQAFIDGDVDRDELMEHVGIETLSVDEIEP